MEYREYTKELKKIYITYQLLLLFVVIIKQTDLNLRQAEMRKVSAQQIYTISLYFFRI